MAAQRPAYGLLIELPLTYQDDERVKNPRRVVMKLAILWSVLFFAGLIMGHSFTVKQLAPRNFYKMPSSLRTQVQLVINQPDIQTRARYEAMSELQFRVQTQI